MFIPERLWLQQWLWYEHQQYDLNHNAVEGNQDFCGIIGSRLGFAPFIRFGVAAQVLLADVGFNVFGDAEGYKEVGVKGDYTLTSRHFQIS
jgi:hypothetical protein